MILRYGLTIVPGKTPLRYERGGNPEGGNQHSVTSIDISLTGMQPLFIKHKISLVIWKSLDWHTATALCLKIHLKN